ncbi:5'-3' exonuclease H3TH domain-containing protein [Pararhizobium qamdonense]|uniref:5'-3' exonuclease H3TH domain-containing protein n=1 Tax=Pararhizobium qamdonense TaxID=3031126 RepID=UPI0023E0DA28|nr:5'-3' exonuclease H3TH domain-containing protein [Pararhizobium qamdonense]
MSQRYLLIDGMNITHAANNAKVLKVGETQVQAIYHFVKIVRKLVAAYPTAKPAVLWDGASWRYMDFPEYKANRKKDDTPSAIKAAEMKKVAENQIPAIKKAMQLLGMPQVRASNMEADDLAAIMGDRYVAKGGRVVLVSGDKDWVQVVNDKIIWLDPIRDRKIMKPADMESALGYKLDSFEAFVEMKCLAGDSGDGISGIGGIGEKGAIDFLNEYGSTTNFSNMLLDGTLDPKRVPKKFRDFAESEEKQMIFQRNRKLMDLRTKLRPDPINLKVDAGEPDIERFRTFCNRLMFRSITKELEPWISVFPAFHSLQEELAA